MRKSASQIINDLEMRVARLERQAIMHPSMLNRDFFNEEDHTPKVNKVDRLALKKIEKDLVRAGHQVSVNGDYESLEFKDFKALTMFGVKADALRKVFNTDYGFYLPKVRVAYDNGDKLFYGLSKGTAFRNGVQLFVWL